MDQASRRRDKRILSRGRDGALAGLTTAERFSSSIGNGELMQGEGRAWPSVCLGELLFPFTGHASHTTLACSPEVGQDLRAQFDTAHVAKPSQDGYAFSERKGGRE